MTTTPTLDAIARVDALRTELDAMRPLNADRLGAAMQRLRIEWTYHSNAIEGNSLDYGETRALLMHGVTAAGKPLKDHLDITGHREALDYLEHVVQDAEPLTLTGIREMHKLLLGEPYESWAETPDGQRVRRTITPGTFKTQPNHVLTATGETHYYASPEDVPAQMSDLVDLIRSTPDVHPLVFASDVHHRFAAIHPFDDGNGRMARLLMNLVLMRAGYPPAVLRHENRPAYYGALAAADGDDLAPLVRFVADELAATTELYIRALRGEPNPDAFSRRLGLLKREIETRGTVVERSPEALQRIASAFINPLIDKLQIGVSHMNDMFASSTTTRLYKDSIGDQYLGDLGLHFKKGTWSSFTWMHEMKGYKPKQSEKFYISVEGVSDLTGVTIIFNPNIYNIRILYEDTLRFDPINIAQIILDSLLDRIEQIDHALRSPSEEH